MYSLDEHNADLNSFFSGFCDVRVIWGGDQTIDKIREAKIPSRAIDITFADRFSGCIIKAKGFLQLEDKSNIFLALIIFLDEGFEQRFEIE